MAVLLQLGCTTMRPAEPGAVAAVLAELNEGDRVSIRTSEAWHRNYRVVGVDGDRIEVRPWGGAPVALDREEILEVHVPRPAPGKTAGLSAGLVIGAILGVHLAAGWELD